MKMNRIKLHKQVETMNKEQLIVLCKSLIDINCELEDRKDKAIEELKELRHWIVSNKHNENTKEHYLVVDYGTLVYKLNNLDILRGEIDES